MKLEKLMKLEHKCTIIVSTVLNETPEESEVVISDPDLDPDLWAAVGYIFGVVSKENSNNIIPPRPCMDGCSACDLVGNLEAMSDTIEHWRGTEQQKIYVLQTAAEIAAFVVYNYNK